jgi:MipA family protein
MKLGRPGSVALAAALVCPIAAWAADPVPSAGVLPPPAADWTVTIGVEGRFEPDFQGADRNVWRPFPLFDLRRVGTPERFHAPRDGAGIAIYEAGTFQVGPVGLLRSPRLERNDPALQGLGKVDWALEAGGFAEYWAAPWLRFRAEVRQGLTGHHGVASDVMIDGVFAVTPQFTLSGGPRASFASTAATSPYFSIDPVQSVASGLPTFDAKGGAHSLGLGGQARYRWVPQWATHAFVEYERLQGDAASSPLVTQRGDANQFTFGLGVTRSFDIKGFW